jgi:N-acetylglutamate synthase-like GNAT family acetyltransferase
VSFSIRPVTDSDRPFLRTFMREHWGDEAMIDRDRVFYPAEHFGFLAEERPARVIGLITHQFENGECEVSSLESLSPGQGIGGALLEAVVAEARKGGCRRVWLITTNDNINALRFYQKRGFHIVAVYPDAVTHARTTLKPSIPLVGDSGIPIRDELELELIL